MRKFSRLAAVPGISYEGSERVRKSFQKKPRLTAYDRAFGPEPKYHSSSQALQWVEETLELSGTPSDYHYGLLVSCNLLYKGRHEDPGVLQEVERFCLVDVNLVERYPGIIEDEFSPGSFAHADTFDRLIRIYEQEGYLHEALEMAERGLRAGQERLESRAIRLRERLGAIKAEDAGWSSRA